MAEKNIAKKELDKAEQRKVMRKSTYIIFLGIIIASALTVFVVRQSPSIKEHYEAVAPTNLALLRGLKAFKVEKNGGYSLAISDISQDDELSFKVSVLRSTFVELVASVNEGKPEVLFYTRLPPGRDRLLERQGNRYSYHTKSGAKNTKFCVVYADSKAGLQKMNNNLGFVWPQLLQTSCVTVR